MFNSNKIRQLCKKRRIPLKELASAINISQTGLQSILKNNSTKIKTLEKIANYFNVPTTYFYTDYEVAKEDILNESEVEYGDKSGNIELLKQKLLSCTEKIEILEQRIKDKDDIIELLRK